VRDIVVKELNGYSGNKVELVQRGSLYLVKKEGDVVANYKRLVELSDHGFNVPKVKLVSDSVLEMEYIHGIGIKDLLKMYDVDMLYSFIEEYFNKCLSTTIKGDFTKPIHDKIDSFNFYHLLPFTSEQIKNKIPTEYPKTLYHGDFTLENILYSKGKFYLIDGLESQFKSCIFDLAKLRQDIDCHWFLRNEKTVALYSNLDTLSKKIYSKFGNYYNEYLLIFMLMRVMAYAIRKEDKDSIQFLTSKINTLWR
jgi:tRNA A-37 threonylcarbamoyl transferase component Bud32